jgi:hypothetical protein
MRSRLAEHFHRIVQEDCIALFNRTIDLTRIECSIVLPNAAQLTPEQKYKAAAVLTVLTGQIPAGGKCKVEWEDPLALRLSKAQQQLENQARSAALARQFAAKSATKSKSKLTQQKKLTADDFKEASAGFRLLCTIGRVRMWDFLEKLREFCLPDTSGILDPLKEKSGQVIEHGHDNSRPDVEIKRQFQKICLVKQPTFNPRVSFGFNDNPESAITAYVLKSHELLKFPDIEIYFEALGEVLKDTGSDTNKPNSSLNNPNSVRIILRPHLHIHQLPISQEYKSVLPQVDNLRIMNWLLAQFFNEYLHRPLMAIQ